MRNWQLKNVEKSTFEKTSFIPRSIFRIFEKFKNQLDDTGQGNIIEQIKISRYQSLSLLKSLCIIFGIPIIINLFSKIFIFSPLIDYYWHKQEFDVFLNSSQQLRALEELQNFEEKLRFNILIGKEESLSITNINAKIKFKANQLAKQYNEESKTSIKNIFSDILTSFTIIILLIRNKRQLLILSSILNEILYGLSDTAKSFFIILFTDIFVGYHSSHGWEILLENLLRHFGFLENREFIFLFIATFPVLLDTVFKYWIFRYLNRVSPSAVATYRTMNK